MLRYIPLDFREGHGTAAYGEHRSLNVWANGHRDGAQTGTEMVRPRAGGQGSTAPLMVQCSGVEL